MNKIVTGLAGVFILVAVSTGAAQTKAAAPGDSHIHGSEASQMQSTPMPMMSPEMMKMMCSHMAQHGGGAMMGGPMGPGMMGGMMAPADPKTQARMLRFRADMMKAMSDVMLKHAAELEKEK